MQTRQHISICKNRWYPNFGKVRIDGISLYTATDILQLISSDLILSLFYLLLFTEPSSLLYAPSTIAISALILSFSIMHVDCSDLLSSIPNFFFHAPKSSDKRFYDIDSCLIHFRGLNAIFPPRVLVTCDPSRTSPVSIATAQSPGSPTAQDLFQPISICGNKRRRNADVFDKMAYADDDSDAPPLKTRNLKL